MMNFTHRVHDYKLHVTISYTKILFLDVFLLTYPLFFFSGHIGITVDDTYKACERFERLGVEFVKKPDDGKGARSRTPLSK